MCNFTAQNKDFIEDFEQCILRETVLVDGRGWLTAKNDNNANLNLMVTLPEGATQLLPGIYPINGTEEFQTVYAGTGINPNGTISSSYACYRNSSGGATTPLWFIVKGEMRVGPTGVVEVEATNSYGRVIHCWLGPWMLPVENVAAEDIAARKIIRNGQIFIIRDNKTYTLTGQEIR